MSDLAIRVHCKLSGPFVSLAAQAHPGFRSCLQKPDSGVKKVLDIVAKQMIGEGSQLAQVSARKCASSLGCLSPGGFWNGPASSCPRAHARALRNTHTAVSGCPPVQKLERAGLLPAPVGEQQSLAYVLDFAVSCSFISTAQLQFTTAGGQRPTLIASWLFEVSTAPCCCVYILLT